MEGSRSPHCQQRTQTEKGLEWTAADAEDEEGEDEEWNDEDEEEEVEDREESDTAALLSLRCGAGKRAGEHRAEADSERSAVGH